MSTLAVNARSAAPSTPNRAGTFFVRAAYWLAPVLLCLAVYHRGLTAWFQQDDFAWLALRLHIHDWRSLLHYLFAPMAEGTIRPWSERAFFLGFESLFGLNALPFRIWVFLTECLNLVLLAAITRRVTGSSAAGLCAASLWLVNNGLAVPMVWTSAYNQILCGSFLLGAFRFLLRYIDTGRPSDNLWQWALFLLGFGALEINIVYPALAALYTFLCARKYFRSTLPLFVPSVLFAAIHWMAAPGQSTGVYALHFDSAIPGTFLTYSWHALAPFQLLKIKAAPDLLAWVLAAALVGFAVARSRQKDWLPVFFLGWFAIVLAPVLPLRDHVLFYYLTLPAIGIAMLAGYALAIASRSNLFWKAVALVLVAVYVVVMVRADRTETAWWRDRSLATRRMVLGVVRARQLHPAQTILLDGVDGKLYSGGVGHYAFDVFGVHNVFLTPGSSSRIKQLPGEAPVWDMEMPAGPVVYGLNHNQIVVYQIGGPRLKAITSVYRDAVADKLAEEMPRLVEPGNPSMAYLLGPEWYSLDEKGIRWMGRRATLRIGGPRSSSERLYLKGFRSEGDLQAGPMPIRISVDGAPLDQILLRNKEIEFHVSLTLPHQAVGKTSLEIVIESGRTFRPSNDERELSIAFGFVEIR